MTPYIHRSSFPLLSLFIVMKEICGFIDVLSEHMTRFLLCGELAESSNGSTYQDVLEGGKSCIEIPQRHILVWIMV